MENDQFYDLFVIGGGINGAGVAADAAGRGLSVLLCEKDDLAQHTSSASSKLIHGGLRYLEQHEFKLVREALAEREILLKIAPHLVQVQPFILPCKKQLRSAWKIRLGLWLYDHLAKQQVLAKSKRVNLKSYSELKDHLTFGFRYFDCKADDARLVIANAQQAYEHGATILTRTKVVKATREKEHWKIELEEKNQRRTVRAKAIVNATGAWVVSVLNEVLGVESKSKVRLVKGSHFTVPSFYSGKYAYILQIPDGRIVFTIPYQNNFTLIGTTDIEFTGDPNSVCIEENEIEYLLDSLKLYFSEVPKREDINWCFSGVRSLYDDDAAKKPSNITREYHLELNAEHPHCPVLSIFGGKITTYRCLSEHVLEKLQSYFPEMKKSWTAEKSLPGGDLSGLSLQQFISKLGKIYPAMPWQLLTRLAHNYGSNAFKILGKTKEFSGLGQVFSGNFTEKELEYLLKHEWAETLDDILWRRSKLGLLASDSEIECIRQRIIEQNLLR